MKDFFKIFFALAALLVTFMIGRNFGEKAFLESDEYKKIVESRDELDYTRSDLANIKTKLQNVIDRGSNQKTDELLGQILQVFLADLGLQIQNKELLLQKARIVNETPATKTQLTVEVKSPEKAESLLPPLSRPKSIKRWKTLNDEQFKKTEARLIETSNEKEIFKLLRNLRISNIDNYLAESQDALESTLGMMTGIFVGAVYDINSRHYGSLSYKLTIPDSAEAEIKKYSGEISFSSEQHGSSRNTFSADNFGQMIFGYRSVIVRESQNRYFQFYKIKAARRLAGNYYEKLPNGTVNLIGQFVLNRVDQF